MKKQLVLSIAALVSLPVLAAPYGEIYQNSDNETSFKAGYALDNGLMFDLEHVHDFNQGEGVETELGAAFNYQINDQLYVKPQLSYTYRGYGDEKQVLLDKAGYQFDQGGLYKIGLESGYDFNNGLYVSGRYRYERSQDTLKLQQNGKTLASSKDKLGLHRTDLTLGYNLDVVDLSANWIHKRSNDKFTIDGVKGSEKIKGSANEYEFKASFNQLGTVKPYLQYTVKSDTEYKLDKTPLKLKNDNEFRLGISAAF